MKSKTLFEKLAGGVDQRNRPDANGASQIVNMRLDEQGYGWVNDRGWEELIEKNTHTAFATSTYADSILRLNIWERHSGSEIYYLEKHDDGIIRARVANNSGVTSTFVVYHVIALDRTLAKPDDADEQFVPFGRFMAIINGKDQMLKYWGRDRTFPFGFTQQTPALNIMTADPNYFFSPKPNSQSNEIAISFGSGSTVGLGTSANNDVNSYRYKMTYITDTGSESPLSDAVQVGWQNKEDDLRFGTMIQDMPVGPPGCVKRRIYRTKNLSNFETGGDVIYYLLTEIEDNVSRNYVDAIPDNLLVVQAPSENDSVVISNNYKYGASWNGHFWLAGGSGTETRLIYSERGLPEQFPAFNYFDLGNTAGGSITGLFSYYDNLLVFREKSIDIVRSRGNGDTYSVSTLTTDIGTTAANTIQHVPGYGVMFLSYDGIYLISGGTLGGSSVDIKRVSDRIHKEMKRLSVGSLATAKAAYSHKEKEYWVMYPVDGNTKCTRGTVFHSLAGVWSFRHAEKDSAGVSALGSFRFNDISTNPNGWFVLAPEVTITAGIGFNFVGQNAGLQVWSATDKFGQSTTFTNADDNIYTLSVIPTVRDPSVWESVWEDFGDDSAKKRVASVEIEMLTRGHNDIEMLWATEWKDVFTSAGNNPQAVPEFFKSINEDSIMGSTTNTEDKSIATIGTDVWNEPRVVRIRWDVQTSLISTFKFRIKTSNVFQIVSYQMNYIDGGRKTVNMRAGL